MEPKFKLLSDENEELRFRLFNIDVSIANAIRRTILSDIPINVIHTETYNDNKCNIIVNKTRLHNEIIKQRLSSIPIHQTKLDILPEEYILELDVTNDTENMLYVTTEHFKIRHKKTNKFIEDDKKRKIFPPCEKTNYYIDFVRLRPKISDNIQSEQIKLTAEFSIGTAKLNSMYSVVSKCAYCNSPDDEKINEKLLELDSKLHDETKEERDFQKKNFILLDAQRYYINNSFDFVIKTIGIYENRIIVKMACDILIKKFQDMINILDSDSIQIYISETTMEYSYDVILENEDYTVGKVLEFILYEKYYQLDKILSYCGFKKMHPHDPDSVIRLAFNKNSDREDVKSCLRYSCSTAKDVFEKVMNII